MLISLVFQMPPTAAHKRGAPSTAGMIPKPKQRKRAGGTTKKQKRVGRARAIQVGDRVQKMFGDTMYDGTITEIDTEAPKRGGKRASKRAGRRSE